LQQAANLQPNDAGAQYNLAVALSQAQRAGEARAALERALIFDPNHAKARAALQSLEASASPPAAPPAPDAAYGLASPNYTPPQPIGLNAPNYSPPPPVVGLASPNYTPPQPAGLGSPNYAPPPPILPGAGMAPPQGMAYNPQMPPRVTEI